MIGGSPSRFDEITMNATASLSPRHQEASARLSGAIGSGAIGNVTTEALSVDSEST